MFDEFKEKEFISEKLKVKSEELMVKSLLVKSEK
jgi:hypothetical protein